MRFLKQLTSDTLRYALNMAICGMALLAMSGITSCSSEMDPPVKIDDQSSQIIFLSLDVTPLENATARKNTRANEIDSENYFELPEPECEKLRSLRVILVDQSTGKIEANRYIAIGKEGNPVGDNLIFRTVAGEKKVFLFGNEESLGEESCQFLESQRAGTMVGNLDDLTLSRKASGEPLLDFSKSDYNGYSRVPMSECWDIVVEDAEKGGTHQHADLFITRAVTKFSFRIQLSDDFRGIPADSISEIVVNGIGHSEYLLPRNTIYSPAKGENSANPYGGRWITQFTTPASDNPRSQAVYRFEKPVVLRNLGEGRIHTLSPAIYYPESSTPQGGFTCQLRYGKLGLTDPIQLPNLDILPRNTHVVVNITIGNDYQTMLSVRVLPWNSEIYEYDYTTNIGIPADGYLSFDAGTYLNLNKQTARVLLDYPNPVRARFGISTPIGATWDAYLITTSGEEDAIRFRTVDASGTYTYTTHISGVVGNARNIIDITSMLSPGSTTRSSRLQILVTLPGGVTVPVNILNSKEYGSNEYMTIVQNPQ